jgi:hypothetical protein
MMRSFLFPAAIVIVLNSALALVAAPINAPAKPGASRDSTEPKVTTFPATKVEELRGQVRKIANPGDSTQDGWAKSPVDPTKVVPVFVPLHIKDGYTLKAYLFRSGGNGKGYVWAMPTNAEFPEPANCPKVKSGSLDVPKPTTALDDVMEVIQGDDSPWSYLAASLLQRELKEFGARWHGLYWTVNRVLGENPLQAGNEQGRSTIEGPIGKPGEWKWLEPAPKKWSPQVTIEKDRVTVTFFTYCGLGRQMIYRHTDTFKRGGYRFKTERKEIAQGPGGFLF